MCTICHLKTRMDAVGVLTTLHVILSDVSPPRQRFDSPRTLYHHIMLCTAVTYEGISASLL